MQTQTSAITSGGEIEAFLEKAPIFLQSWWLEVVAPGKWQYIAVQQSGHLAAVMPLIINSFASCKFIDSPLMTPYLGPWFAESSNDFHTKRRNALALLEELPSFNIFAQAFHPGITDWLPYFWNGFTQTTRYTYQIADTSNLDVVQREMKDSARWEINKARNQLKIEEAHDITDILRLHKLTLKRQGLNWPTWDAIVFNLHHVCVNHNCCKILIARDATGLPHAGAFFIWDNSHLYYFMSGADPALRNSGAGSLIIWHGIELASNLKLCFDFEGSMHKPIEGFFRSFGAKQVPYFAISKKHRTLFTTTIYLLRHFNARLNMVLNKQI
jgi:hypothetical protein